MIIANSALRAGIERALVEYLLIYPLNNWGLDVTLRVSICIRVIF